MSVLQKRLTVPAPLTLINAGEAIDRLAAVRADLKGLDAEEKQLTLQIKTCLADHGMTVLRTGATLARITQRITQTIDAGRFIELTGAPGFAALVVSVTKARELAGVEALKPISEFTLSPVLSIESR